MVTFLPYLQQRNILTIPPKGSLEAWLLLRSLRTFHLRVPRQSQTATALAQWLDQVSQTSPGKEFEGIPGGVVLKVWHSSLQAKTADWDVAKQMEGGWNATFSFMVISHFSRFTILDVGFSERASYLVVI